MKIYDSFMFFDEEMLLDLRLNILNKYVDKFIITESKYTHKGELKELTFNINKYEQFKNKIIYNVVSELPPNIEPINEEDDKKTREIKFINNSYRRENHQREVAAKCLDEANPEDVILINDIDEMPNLENINFNKISNKIIMFKQKMFYYKFNLLYESKFWYGSRACRKKNLKSPQWLRNVKEKKYPLWRLDIAFSKTKYNDIYYVENGGWHFTYMKSPEGIEKKLSNFLHYREFEESGLSLIDIKNMVKNRKVIYDHSIDQRDYKWSGNKTLKKVDLSEMPKYLKDNYKKYSSLLE